MTKQQEWRLLKLKQNNAAMNMAIDEAILISRIKNKVPNTLRFFTWDPKAVTIGYFQSLQKEINLDKLKELNLDIVRRYTGGGAVLHDKELTYSVFISEKEVCEDVLKSYEIICKSIILGLNLFGIDSEFKPINDIIANNKKISGNAQTRKQGIILQHGTILLDVDVKKMFSVLKIPDEKIKDKLIQFAEERVTSLKNIINREISPEELEPFIIKGFEEIFNIKLIQGELTKEEIETAEKLYNEKYSTKEWVFLK
jgi:lipoyltransferase/lipoate-protein ligase